MSDDSRKDQRVKVQTLKAKYKSATIDEFVSHYAADISRGGIFIKTTKPAAINAMLKIEIQLKDGTPVIEAIGKVVRRREQPENGEPAGMGIKFLKLEGSSQQVVERIVASKGEDAGPRFDSEPPPAGETNSDFFGKTNPEQEMPAVQDRTMMRQMSAFLNEALRGATGDAATPEPKPEEKKPEPKPAVKPADKPVPKHTIMGMPPVRQSAGGEKNPEKIEPKVEVKVPPKVQVPIEPEDAEDAPTTVTDRATVEKAVSGGQTEGPTSVATRSKIDKLIKESTKDLDEEQKVPQTVEAKPAEKAEKPEKIEKPEKVEKVEEPPPAQAQPEKTQQEVNKVEEKAQEKPVEVPEKVEAKTPKPEPEDSPKEKPEPKVEKKPEPVVATPPKTEPKPKVDKAPEPTTPIEKPEPEKKTGVGLYIVGAVVVVALVVVGVMMMNRGNTNGPPSSNNQNSNSNPPSGVVDAGSSRTNPVPESTSADTGSAPTQTPESASDVEALATDATATPTETDAGQAEPANTETNNGTGGTDPTPQTPILVAPRRFVFRGIPAGATVTLANRPVTPNNGVIEVPATGAFRVRVTAQGFTPFVRVINANEQPGNDITVNLRRAPPPPAGGNPSGPTEQPQGGGNENPYN